MNIHDFTAEWERLLDNGLTDSEARDRMLSEKAVADGAREARKNNTDSPIAGKIIPIPTQRHQAVGCAMRDVMALACDIRDLDPAECWTRIETWSPTRVVSALIVAAAAIDPATHTDTDLWGWTRGLAS